MSNDKWSASSPVFITVAPTGAELAKSDWPQLPVTLAELVATAKSCEAAGAAMIHVHVRDDQARPSLDVGRLKETVAALRESTSLVVQLSTGGSVHDSAESRLAVLDAEPDSCSLTCGTLNFGDDVFMNPYSLMAQLYQRAQERGVVPEFEIFDVGQLWSLERLIGEFGLPVGGKVHVDFVLGVPGGLPGSPQALAHAVGQLPEQATSWCATGVGRAHLPVMAATLALGGNLRVGMEDNVFFARKRPVEDNAEFVKRAVNLIELLQRPLMTPSEVFTLLGRDQL